MPASTRSAPAAVPVPVPADSRGEGELSAVSWSHLLARGIGPAALALTLGFAMPAQAELIASHAAPSFSAADLETIARNETLRRAVADSPWLVHRILRVLEDDAAQRGRGPAPDERTTRDIDLGADPDLQALQRSSPEAAHDLFLMIKQAGKGGSPSQ